MGNSQLSTGRGCRRRVQDRGRYLPGGLLEVRQQFDLHTDPVHLRRGDRLSGPLRRESGALRCESDEKEGIKLSKVDQTRASIVMRPR